MPQFRAPMRSRRDHIDPGVAVARALDQGLVGMGGLLATTPDTLAEALAELSETYDERCARRVERFAEVPDEAIVWTQDSDGLLWRGLLAGPWRYDDHPDAIAADLVHVRMTRWDDAGLEEHRAPAAVVASFARGGRNFQRIRAADLGGPEMKKRPCGARAFSVSEGGLEPPQPLKVTSTSS